MGSMSCQSFNAPLNRRAESLAMEPRIEQVLSKLEEILDQQDTWELTLREYGGCESLAKIMRKFESYAVVLARRMAGISGYGLLYGGSRR